MSLRAFLEEAFAGDFTGDDWQHCLGGTTIVLSEGDAIVAHAAVVPRTLTVDGRPLRCGYVEGVAVRADRRGRGLGAAVMAAAERVVTASYDLGALASTDEAIGFYARLGWQVWRGPLLAGTEPTPGEQGGVFVLEVTAPLDLDAPLACDLRAGDPW